MPFQMLRLRPGINTELTPSQVEAGYAASQLIRFRNNLAEKLGGWDRFYQFAVGGVPKAMHAWLDLNEAEYLAVGTTTLLGSINSSTLTNITPQTYTSNFNENFSTTSASPNVVVDDSNIANVTDYDSVEFLTPIAVGGLILSGVYPIALNLGTTTYRIVAPSNATGTVNNGGAVPSFTTTNGSATVTVTLVAHGLSIGGKINFPISTTVGGIAILGTYTALTVPTADTFTIAASALATSGATVSMNSGQARIQYHIALGPQTAGTGYGIGTYGSGGYGTGTTSSAQTGTNITATDWTLDNWGEILTACPDGGAIYTWQPGAGFQNAGMVSGQGAPPYNTGMFIASEIQIMIAYGSTAALNIGLDQDPLLVKWSDQGDYTNWEEGTASQAGSRRLSSGSMIVAGMASPQFNLLWTDVGLWSMSYISPPLVFGFNPIGFGCGLIGKHAAVRQGANIYWMGYDNFWVLGGGAPQVVPCTVWDFVFQDLNTTYRHKCWAWSNTSFNEVSFFFPRASTSATEPDAYVKINTLSGAWDFGVLDRSCGIDQSFLAKPLSATPSGLIYEHEVSANADGQPMVPSFTSGEYQLSEGQDVMLVDWVLPDMKFGDYPDVDGSASIQITFYSRFYPGGAQRTYGPYTFTSSTKYINTRIRGRLISFKMESSDLNSYWRVGGCRFRIAPDGRL